MANDLLRGRQTAVSLTNKSGGQVVAGDVVVLDSVTASSFTTTTSAAQTADWIGVALETIANDATGRVCIFGYVPTVNLASSASLGDYIRTHTVAKQAQRFAATGAGDFGQVLGTGTTPAAIIWGRPDQGAGTPGTTTATIQARVTLYDNILGAGGSWDVSSIDQTYDHLELLVIARGTNAALTETLGMNLNNNITDANYRVGYHIGATSHLSAAADSRGIATIPGNTALASSFGQVKIFIPNYTKTTMLKTSLAIVGERDDSAGTSAVEQRHQNWENTAAINRIAILGLNTANLATNSRFVITGIKELTVVTGLT